MQVIAEGEFMEEIKKASDLKVMIGMKQEITVKGGQKLELHPLDICDLADLQDMYGDISKLMSTQKLKDILFFIWLSVRKTGLSPDQIDNQKWVITTPRALSRYFELNDLSKLFDITSKISVISGLVEEESVKKSITPEKEAVEEKKEPSAEPK